MMSKSVGTVLALCSLVPFILLGYYVGKIKERNLINEMQINALAYCAENIPQEFEIKKKYKLSDQKHTKAYMKAFMYDCLTENGY